MNAIGILAAVGLFTFSISAAVAAPVVINKSGAVTSVTGGNLSEGYAPFIAPGSPVSIGITIDPVGFTALQIFQGSPFQISLGFTGASALIQTCCIDEAASDLDPTDGAITLRGFLGGFTGAPVGAYTTSAGAFAMTFRVFGSDIPLAPFATGNDVLTFFSAASLSLEGFARQNFNPINGGSAFSQNVNFVGGVPLPAAAWMFLAGIGGLFVRIRRVH
jgi:hypothetical protein